jgi:hypothetical protein
MALKLPFQPPIEPMLAKLTDEVPDGPGYLYEPKWDGFRAIVFRDGDETFIQSRDLRPLDRYFPELAPALEESLPARCVVDGEIVIPGPDGLDFEALLLRIHPAASRVALLAGETPASFVAWDLLALGDRDSEMLNQARQYLAFVLYQREDFWEAAAVGSFLSRSATARPEGLRGGLMALSQAILGDIVGNPMLNAVHRGGSPHATATVKIGASARK